MHGTGENGLEDLDEFDALLTLPETNISPENGPLEKEIPIGNHHFQVLLLLVSGRVVFSFFPGEFGCRLPLSLRDAS